MDVNGGVRDLLGELEAYLGVDVVDGPGVDVVADASVWCPPWVPEVVVCCEVFEHAEVWPGIVGNVWSWLEPGGLFVATWAGPGRHRHRADGSPGDPLPDEWYENVSDLQMDAVLREVGWSEWELEVDGGDVRLVAVR